MKKRLLLVLSLLLLLGACTKEAKSTDPSPATAMLVDIAHPDLVPEAVAASEAFTYARQRADVIIAGGEVVTGPDTITGIMGNIMGGAADTFTLARFHGDWWSLTTYTGTYILLAEEVANYHGGLDSLVPTETYSYTHTVVDYTGYHYLLYAPDETFEPASTQLVNERDFIADFDAKERIRRQYIEPISPSAIMADWTADGYPEVDIIWLFEDLYRSDVGYMFEDYPDGRIPYDLVWGTLHRYFPAMPESRLKANRYYDAATNAFIYEGGRGGLSPVFYVIDYAFEEQWVTPEQIGEQWVIVDYIGYNYLTGEPEGEPRRLVATLADDWHYVSNLPAN